MIISFSLPYINFNCYQFHAKFVTICKKAQEVSMIFFELAINYFLGGRSGGESVGRRNVHPFCIKKGLY